MARYRIFLTTSPLNTLLVSGYAKETKVCGDTDILILDRLPQKPSIVSQIKKISQLHGFDEILDFSLPLSDYGSTKPTITKRITRFLKRRPGFKQVYDFLFWFRKESDLRKYKKLLQSAGLHPDWTTVEIHLQPLLRFNKPLKKLYPQAKVHYFEHGIGDYLDVLDEGAGSTFHCVFDHGLKEYLKKRGQLVINVNSSAKHLPSLERSTVLNIFPELESLLNLKGDYVLLLTQPLEDLGVSKGFWSYFLEQALHKIENPLEKVFLLKIHSRQNLESVNEILNYLKEKGIQIKVLNDPRVTNICMEIVFGVIQENVHYVIAPYSSAIFYLPKLYLNAQTKFFYSYNSLNGFDKLTPIQYKARWSQIQLLTKEIGEGLAVEF